MSELFEYTPKVEQASLYGEEQIMHNVSTMTDEQLDDKAQRFIALMNDPTSLPTHRALAARMIDYIAFETMYRDRILRQSEEDLAWDERESA
jgi:hypothetical protein